MLALVTTQQAAAFAAGYGPGLSPVTGAETVTGVAAGVLLSAGALVVLKAQRNGLLHLRRAGATRQRAGLAPTPGYASVWVPGWQRDAGEQPLPQLHGRLREWLQAEPPESETESELAVAATADERVAATDEWAARADEWTAGAASDPESEGFESAELEPLHPEDEPARRGRPARHQSKHRVTKGASSKDRGPKPQREGRRHDPRHAAPKLAG